MLTNAQYPATEQVDILYQAPAHDSYEIIASFEGSEPRPTGKKTGFPILIDEAKQLGADAIWIQAYRHYVLPGDWVLLEGKMTKIYPQNKDSYKGVLIRY